MKLKKYRSDVISLMVTVVLGIIIVLASPLIFEGGFSQDKLNKGVEYYEAEITAINKEVIKEDKYIDGIELGYQEVRLKIKEGPYKTNEYDITNTVSRLYNTKVSVGSKIIVAMYFAEGGLSDMNIYSFKRSNYLGIMAILFLIVILVVGGFKGLKSIVSLLFTMVCVIFLMLPLMLRGISPIISAILVAILSITATLILVSGINRKSISAILGTVIGVLIAGTLAYTFGELTNLSGVNSTDAESVMYIAESTGLKIHGIMFAGILVSALGAVMDVAMSISSSVFEIQALNKDINFSGLFKSGMNIGRDIIGTMSNTLILAFAGGSLNTLILLYSASMTSNQLFNLDIVGTELIQGLAGSIGIILTVPITAIIAAYLCKKKVVNE